MIDINIKDMRFSADFIKRAIDLSDKERTIEHAEVVTERYDKYVNAINKANQFFTGERGSFIYDPPEAKYSYHSMIINLENDEFEGNEIQIFSEIINAFDSMEIVGSSDCKIKIVLIFNCVYREI